MSKSATTTKTDRKTARNTVRNTGHKTGRGQINPIHPGEILYAEFLEPLDLSANALAKHIGVPGNRISAIVKGDRGITGDTALRLAAALGTTPEFWMNLQKSYELEVARDAVSDAGCVTPLTSAA